jgi:DNA-binding SARP family transcriptional activator
MMPMLGAQTAFAQGMFESAGVNASAAGLGAGAAASAGHGRVVRRTYETMLEAEKATEAQTKVIEQYMKVGTQYEAKKQWENAEKTYKYVLQITAQRDGPGSAASVPTLRHLVVVSKEQNNLDDAIGYQSTLVDFARVARVPEPAAVINAEISLSNLYLQKDDYHSAAAVLRDSYTLSTNSPSLPPAKRKVALAAYAKVLRQMHKDAEADAIEKAAGDETPQTKTTDTGLTQQPASTPR